MTAVSVGLLQPAKHIRMSHTTDGGLQQDFFYMKNLQIKENVPNAEIHKLPKKKTFNTSV